MTSWLFPFWIERQVDPKSADYRPVSDCELSARELPTGLGSVPVNDTARDWTLVGNLGSWRRALVDPRGLVTPVDGGWSLDWWIRADDRWHLPSREAPVRQRLIDGTPVIETAMSVPGGNVIHRAYGVRIGSREVVAVEVENATAVPIAVVFAIRPFNPTGLAWIESISLDETRTTASVDGHESLMFTKPPSQLVGSTHATGDCVGDVVSERTDSPDHWRDVSCPAGLAQAAFVFPLTHSATLRVAMPLERGGEAQGSETSGTIRRVRARLSASSEARPPARADGELAASLPSASRVSSGWVTQARRGARFDLPDERLRQAVDSARRHLMLVHGGEELVNVPARSMDFSEAVAVLGALDVCGYADEAEQLLATLPERQASDGWFGDVHDVREQRWDANGAAIHALSEHWERVGPSDESEDLAFMIARAAHAIGKKHANGQRRGRSGREASMSLLPPGAGPRFCGPRGTWVRDAVWSSQGLNDAVGLLRGMGQLEASDEVVRLARRVEEGLRATLAAIPGAVWPSTIERGSDPGIIANLDAINLPHPLGAGLPGLEETVESIRRDLTVDDAVHTAFGPTGMSPRYTAMLGRAELHLGMHARDEPITRLNWLVSHASATWAWPEAQHPTRGGGTSGAGHDGVATAWFLRLVRDLVVRETADGGLALCTAWPTGWLGHTVEVHDAPTIAGLASFAIRWHGDRPAVLWEIERPDRGGVRLTVPGLDPSWSSTEPRGEALLRAPGEAVKRAGSSRPDGE